MLNPSGMLPWPKTCRAWAAFRQKRRARTTQGSGGGRGWCLELHGRTGGITTPRSIWERINQQATSDEGKTIKGGREKNALIRILARGMPPGRRQNTGTVLGDRKVTTSTLQKNRSRKGGSHNESRISSQEMAELWR